MLMQHPLMLYIQQQVLIHLPILNLTYLLKLVDIPSKLLQMLQIASKGDLNKFDKIDN